MPHLLPTRPRLRTAAVLLVLVLSACSTAIAPIQVAGGGPVPKATPVRTPTPTPVAAPAPTEPGPLVQAQPFTMRVTEVRVQPVDNGALFGVAGAPPDPAAADQAVDVVAAAVTTFLDAQLVDRDTRFSDAGIGVLVDPAQLDPATRAALVPIPAEQVRGTVTGAASATADVLMDGAAVEAVTLTYAATLTLVLRDGIGLVRHSGTITFTPLQGQLTLVSWRPTTSLGGNLAEVLP